MYPIPLKRRIPLAMIVILLYVLAVQPIAVATPAAPLSTTVFVNEIHYDNTSTDTGEAIEVAAPSGTDLTGWTIILYNGNGGASYDTDSLGAVAGTCDTYDLYVINYPSNGIQNGAPDGIALVDAGNTVIQFLSYEGTFTATNGPANGMTSTDITVTENGSGAVGNSLQLAGSGTVDTDFTWQSETVNTFGVCNTGQTFAGGGITDAGPSVSNTTPAANATNVDPAANISITFNEDVTVTGAWYDMTCSASGNHTAAVTGGPKTFTLDPNIDFGWGETCTMKVYAAQVADVDTDDPPDTMAADYTWSFTCAANICDDPYTGIYAVQGSGASSPLAGASGVDIEGIVVGDFQGSSSLNGFYVQDPAGDGDAGTSDGIFVYIPAANPFSGIDVLVGDKVHVEGTVKEFNGVTEIDNVTALKRCGAGSVVPTAVNLPEAINGDLEKYEGMLLTFPETLTVSQNYFQGRYGQVTLSSEGRMYNPTNSNSLGDTFELDARRILVLDDGKTSQNPNPIPYIGPDNTLRAGDTVIGLTGTLDYGAISSDSSIRDYRVQPTQPVSFTRVNARPPTPDAVDGNVRVATFNTLNWFYTIDTGPDICGPAADQDCRGADSEIERDRQLAKLLAALKGLDADVVGLMEIENTNINALAELVKALNAASTPGTYAYVTEPAPGVDAIKVSLIYKPAVVMPAGDPQNYQTSTADYDPLFDRPPLAQTFTTVDTGETFTVVVNHFKSKGCTDATGLDLDQGDGQSCWNAKRTAQAAGLLDFIADLQASTGDNDVITIGDFNAYSDEDPIVALEAGGLVSQGDKVPAAVRYTYIFDGFSGELDHVLATASLDAQATGAAIWHINADEPSVIDYNTEFKPQDLYAPDAYRSSDHDPMLVGLGLHADKMIGGYVFLDVNGDSWRNVGEHVGLAGVSLALEDAWGNQYYATSTSTSGWYQFVGLSSGVYTLRVVIPEGYLPTSPTEVTVTVGGLPTVVNFGVQAKPGASIGDFVWQDEDADGVQDASEAGLGGVTLALWSDVNGAPGKVIAATTTGPDGAYLFDGLAKGSYFVQVTDAEGILTGLSITTGPQSMPNPFGPVVLDWGQAYTGADFGYSFTCSANRAAVGGRVWLDLDLNGQQNTGELGVSGVTVCAEPLSYRTLTCVQANTAGIYRMCLRPGTYLVTPAAWPEGLARGQWLFQLPLVARPGSPVLNTDFDLVPAP